MPDDNIEVLFFSKFDIYVINFVYMNESKRSLLGRTILLLIFVFQAVTLSAQKNIIGCIKDEKGKPLEYINVIALASKDSSFLAGCITDVKGAYSMHLPQNSSCILKVSGIGYNTSYTAVLSDECSMKDVILQHNEHLLKGVTVSSSNIIQRIDRKEFVPLKIQIENSANGLDLLDKIKLPGVLVDMIAQSVSSVSATGEVQLRINDVLATIQDVLTLNSSRIIRIGQIDMPGIRYGNRVSQVINFIIRRADSGVSGGVSLMSAVNANYGKENGWMKYNKGNSEFGIQYAYDYTGYKKWETSSIQLLQMTDNNVLKIERNGKCNDYKQYLHDAALTYNWTNPDKTVFNVEFSTDWKKTPLYRNIESIVESGFYNDSMTSTTQVKDNSFTPELDLYFLHKLKYNQSISGTLMGTYIKSDYSRSYEIPDYTTAYSVNGDKYSIYGEFNYEKVFKNGHAFSAGYQQTQAYTDNHYNGSTDNVTTSMHNNEEKIYVQYEGKYHKLGYVIGAGGKRQHFNEETNGFTFYNFQPNISLNYSLSKAITLMYEYNQIYELPSLSDLSNVVQWQNNYEVVKGNPNLHPGHSNINNWAFQYIKDRLMIYASIYYQYNHHDINDDAVQHITEGDSIYFVHTKSNNSNYHHLQSRLYVRDGLFNNKLYLSILIGVNRHIVVSDDYCHTHTSTFGGFSADVYFGRWQLSASYDAKYSGLFSEVLNRYYQSANASVGYKLKNLIMHIGMKDPFITNGRQTSNETLSKVAYKMNDTKIKDFGNMVYLSLSWNFSNGRKHKSGDVEKKYINKDSGIVK